MNMGHNTLALKSYKMNANSNNNNNDKMKQKKKKKDCNLCYVKRNLLDDAMDLL